MLELLAFMLAGWALAATGALRWLGNAILWLVVIGMLGLGVTVTLLAVATLAGAAWGVLEARSDGLPC